ncbi:MAG: DUF6666 family protein [Pirellulaceae bacterium]|nr:DUF6666 family protein [Pirellulaceae bacterium]
MTRLKISALTAIALLGTLFSLMLFSLGDRCYAQTRASTKLQSEIGGPGHTAIRRISGSSTHNQRSKHQSPLNQNVLSQSAPKQSALNQSVTKRTEGTNGLNLRRSPVRPASATSNAEIIAPTTMRGSEQPLASLDAPTDAWDTWDTTLSDPAVSSSGCDSCGGQEVCCCRPTGFLLDWTRAELWAGMMGFSVPSSFLSTASDSAGAIEGSFGFQQGINFGTQVPSLLCGQMGSQIGVRFIQSQLDGSAAAPDHRQQLFLTTGLFRRVDYGVQGGLVVDYLHDDWIYQADLLQLRGELSYLLSPCHELGFRFTDSQQIDDTTYRLRGSSVTTAIRLSSLNTYRGFYRFRFSEQARGQAELHAGWTQDSGAILGVTLNTPLQNQIGLTTTGTYLMPPKDASPSFASEGWNLGLALVWTPGRKFGLARDYYRPLFDVADNGSLISKIH